ncbi:MAG: S46 family peptidase [Bacteroidales bacterium]|nr:S46 family peptidase [Bacteroidales bacterium]
MKKINLLVAMLMLALAMPATADEGMWLLPLLEKLNIKTMQSMGCELSADQIYSINKTSLKDAVVQFGGGCTGEVVSKEGLLLTNHHCGYSAIQKLSSVEHDYLANGFWAMSRSEELPAEGLSVTFLQSFTDVTKQIDKALAKGKTDEEKAQILRKLQDELKAKAEKENKNCRAVVSSFYGGNTYYLIVYKTYNDVRFVGAPPSSIGKFGADTDNWMWPRHTCDFSMFRIYAGKDNEPAAYSPDNVPYKSKNALEVSIKDIKDGDFSMIMGYPGTTNRFMTSSELVETRENNELSIYCRTIRQELMMKEMLADPKVKIQYASKYTSSSNAWKKWIGMNETFEKLNVQARRAADEKAFTEWVSKNNARVEKYGDALEKINGAIAGRKDASTLNRYISETVSRIEISSVAGRLASSVEQLLKAKDDKERKALTARFNATVESFYKDYSAPTDKIITAAMLKIFRDKVAKNDLIDIYQLIDSKFGGDIDAYVENLFATSVFVSKEKFMNDYQAKMAALKQEGKDESKKVILSYDNDPAVILSKSYSKKAASLRGELNKYNKQFAEGKKAYIAGTLEMRKGEAIYPDANSTMRLTYGKIASYSPKDAVVYDYYTTLDGVMEKEDPNNWEFVVPEKLKALHAAKDYGRYARPDGKMPACFIMTGDITGGNSGSPVLDSKGRLTGLAFDGNWEAMSGDIIFEPDLQRCICVDIRYVLFIVDKFGGAGYLLDEMTIVE